MVLTEVEKVWKFVDPAEMVVVPSHPLPLCVSDFRAADCHFLYSEESEWKSAPCCCLRRITDHCMCVFDLRLWV